MQLSFAPFVFRLLFANEELSSNEELNEELSAIVGNNRQQNVNIFLTTTPQNMFTSNKRFILFSLSVLFDLRFFSPYFVGLDFAKQLVEVCHDFFVTHGTYANLVSLPEFVQPFQISMDRPQHGHSFDVQEAFCSLAIISPYYTCVDL